MLTYMICVGTAILVWNVLEGNLIQEWNHMGEGKLRGGRDFAAFTWLFGYLVYVFAPITAYLFVRQSFEEKERWSRITCLVRAAAALAFLIRFMVLDVAGFIAKS